jgi:hypothetical protein
LATGGVGRAALSAVMGDPKAVPDKSVVDDVSAAAAPVII